MADLLEERTMTQAELAQRMEQPVSNIAEIISGKGAITPDIARQLEQVLGVPSSYWLNHEAHYAVAQELLCWERSGGCVIGGWPRPRHGPQPVWICNDLPGPCRGRCMQGDSAWLSRELKPGWQTWRFDQMAVSVNDRIDDPSAADVDHYVGLEHLDTDSLKIRRWGVPSDVEATKLVFAKATSSSADGVHISVSWQ